VLLPTTAVIDIGTNTLLMLIAQQQPNGQLIALEDLCRFGRLGKGLDTSGDLAPASVERSLEICSEYRAVLDRYQIESPTIIATQALREANNSAVFVAPAQQRLRADINIIGGQREAQLAARSVADALPQLHGESYVVMDVGGGSTEFILTKAGTIEFATSIAIGAVRMTERFVKSDPIAATDMATMNQFIAHALSALPIPVGLPLVATAGTATTLAAVHLQLAIYDAARITGLTLSPSQVHSLVAAIASVDSTARAAMPGMVKERVDVICGGAAIVATALTSLKSSSLTMCDRGIRWGLAAEILGNR
jgi:exopolyphosphatase / guanosine-5'-triphosphate,3'-diphosphate pyrophosphatase